MKMVTDKSGYEMNICKALDKMIIMTLKWVLAVMDIYTADPERARKAIEDYLREKEQGINK